MRTTFKVLIYVCLYTFNVPIICIGVLFLILVTSNQNQMQHERIVNNFMDFMHIAQQVILGEAVKSK